MTVFIAGIIGLVIIIVFLKMYSKIKSISDILETYSELEFKKPEYQKTIKCEKCGHEFKISIVKKGHVNCPKCRTFTRI